MKALKTKVILSGIVLVFAFIATIGTTFAWFTVSQTATVDSMSIDVTSANNIVIRPFATSETYFFDGNGDETGTSGEINLAFPSNYDTTVSLEDLYNAGYLGDWDEVSSTLTNAWRIQPSTIIEPGYASSTPKTLSIIDLADGSLTTTTNLNDDNGYAIQLDFWLYSQSESDFNINMTNLDISAISSGGAAAVENAVRLSVWKNGTTWNSTANGDYTVDNNSDAAFIFGNDNDYGYTFPVGSGLDNSTVENYLSGLTLNDLQDEVNIIGTDNPDVFVLEGQVPTLVTVLIYLEGWDAQADNNITNSEFSITFGFEYGTEVV
jgi:hypothetical protein